MADKKTYYYLKLKEGFFDSEDMLLLQGMKDGYIYSDILLKLYLMSLRQDGRLCIGELSLIRRIWWQQLHTIKLELLKKQ